MIRNMLIKYNHLKYSYDHITVLILTFYDLIYAQKHISLLTKMLSLTKDHVLVRYLDVEDVK